MIDHNKHFRRAAELYGASDPEIDISEYTGVGNTTVQRVDVAVRVDLPEKYRKQLQQHLHDPPKYQVSVVQKEPVLTDADLHQLMRAAPDDWGPGDELSLDMFDQDILSSLINEYGGPERFNEAVQNSLAETPDRADDAYALRHHGGDPDPSVPDEVNSDGTVDDLTTLKQSYVSGEIGLLELENRLEDVLTVDVPYEPV